MGENWIHRSSSGMIAGWHFDDVGVTTLWDFTGNGHNGTGVNLDAADHITGRFGKAINFDFGASEGITVSDHADLRLSSFTVTAWVNVDVIKNNPSILSKWNADDCNYKLGLTNINNELSIYWKSEDNTQNRYDTTGDAVPTGEWVFVAGGADSENIRFCINGEMKTADWGQGNRSNGFYAGGTPDIGIAKAFAGDQLDGKLDDVCLFNVLLSSEQMKAIYYMQVRGYK
jgi:hypothetical protein